MKRTFLTAFSILALCLSAKAQVFILNDNLMDGRMAEVSGTVVDSLTNEPIPFASFYVIPAKDTTISNFTLTDAEGKAKLEDVPYGNYVLRVEMLGYHPFVLEKYFRDRMVDMGTIKLKVDDNYLNAAVVTDVGNPIIVKQDTVEFNASSFQVGTNAMLKDLLKRMPGMEITDEGKVKFNGKEIDKLTVGGRTFFFGDQSTALNNLPASIVDKIRVIDRESESTRDTGMQDGAREQVLDVALKKEYEKGWFGNAGVKGGTTAAHDKDNPLRDDRGLLYSGNALVAAYSEKDQLTLIGNGMNINDADGVVFVAVSADGTTRTSNIGQISSAGQLGVNYNTQRIKNFDTTIGGNYKYGDSRSGDKSFRTTFQDDGNIFSSSENSGRGFSNSVAADAEIKKESGKVRVRITPSFSYSRNNDFSTSTSETSREGLFINSSKGDVHSLSSTMRLYDYNAITFRDLWGKKNRFIEFQASFTVSDTDGESDEISLVKTAAGEDRRDLRYQSDSKYRMFGGRVRYAEPIGEKILLSGSAYLSATSQNGLRDAFDAAGRNGYYSSESNAHTISQIYDMTTQYKFTNTSWITLGASMSGMLNETYSKSYGVSSTTGAGEWYWHVTPTMRFQHMIGDNRFSVSTSGTSRQPDRSAMVPVMNIADPSRPVIGNIYLKPGGYTTFVASFDRNNKKRFSNLMMTFYGTVNTRPVTYARWYDSDGIMYAVPLNSKKNSFSSSLYSSYNTPLDSGKKWFLTFGINGSVIRSTSYQPKGTLPGVDKDSFDYSSFMDSFWGDPKGNLFFSGKSGFFEGNTTSYSYDPSVTLRYSSGGFTGRAYSSASREIARYSLNKNLNMNTLDSSVGLSGNYRTKHEFEFDTDLTYHWYQGFAEGYGDPEWRWNIEISKNVKAYTFSLHIHDILDQTRNLNHTVTANYEQDSYTLVMGRYILFGVKWNFGKMNAVNSQRAQNAAWNMAF